MFFCNNDQETLLLTGPGNCTAFLGPHSGAAGGEGVREPRGVFIGMEGGGLGFCTLPLY